VYQNRHEEYQTRIADGRRIEEAKMSQMAKKLQEPFILVLVFLVRGW